VNRYTALWSTCGDHLSSRVYPLLWS